MSKTTISMPMLNTPPLICPPHGTPGRLCGTPDECRRQIEPYRAALSNRTVQLHTPYVPPLSREETADACNAIVDAFGA
jgi:hypothetical protein